MKFLRQWGWLGTCLWLVTAASAWAARPGRIDVEGAELFEGPGRGYSVLEKLARGTPVAASNYPTEGFYKVRTGSGLVGWVSIDSIVIDDLPDPIEPSKQPLNTPSTADPSNPWRGKSPTATHADYFRNRRYSHFLRVRALGGLSFFQADELNSFLSFGGLKNGMHVGGEVNFRFTRDIAMVVRVERMSKEIAGRDSTTDMVFQMDLSAIPIMTGLEITLTEESNFSSYFGIMAGIGLSTSLSSTIVGRENATTTFLSHNFTGLGRLLLAYHLTKTTHFFVEAGYRLLRTQPQIPSSTGDGKEIWQRGGTFQPLSIDLSGVISSVGVALHF